MSNQINDGGPAFPVSDCVLLNGEVQTGRYGMTLRDYFAGQALAGMISRGVGFSAEPEKIARWSYDASDAMIAIRNKGTS